MLLEKVRIENFKSIIDSSIVNLEKDITLLIGMNESGKTNFLLALEKFNPDKEITFSDLPAFKEYDMQEKINNHDIELKNIPVISCFFSLDSSFRENIKQEKESILLLTKGIKYIKITKFANNTYKAWGYHGNDFSQEKEKSLFDYDKKDKLLATFNQKIKELNTVIAYALNRSDKNLLSFAMRLNSAMETILNLTKKPLKTLKDLNILKQNLHEFITLLKRSGYKKDFIDLYKKAEDFLSFVEKKKIDIIINTTEKSIVDLVLKNIPKFVYFSSIDILPDTMDYNKLFDRSYTENKTFINLLKLARIPLDRLEKADEKTRTKLLENASTNITGKINKSWQQDVVSVKIRFGGRNFLILVSDDLVSYTSLSERSHGFRWFLSFYITFNAEAKKGRQKTIFLLDDPGVYLHPAGQRDMMETIEELSNESQFIIATHSPFVIDKSKLSRVRVVVKDQEGTKIKERFTGDKDSFEPIRAALGMHIGDTFGFDKKSVLVEGLSDAYILESVKYLINNARNEKEIYDFSVFPVGGADKMPYFATIVYKENISEFLITLDNDPKGRAVKKELIEKCDIPERNILLLSDVVDEDEKRDIVIEDLINFDFLVELINEAYKSVLAKNDIDRLSSDDITPKNFSGITKFFKKKKLGSFDKILLARTLQRKIIDCVKNGDSCNIDLSNFEKLLKVISKRIHQD